MGTRQGQSGLRIGDVGLVLLELGFEQGGVELRQDLPFFHPAVEIRIQLLHRAGHLGAHVHQHHWAQGAIGRDALDNIAAVNRLGFVFFRGGVGTLLLPIIGSASSDEERENNKRGSDRTD